MRVARASTKIVGLPSYCFSHIFENGGSWGKALTGAKGHNLLQYFAFEYQGILGFGVPLQEKEQIYRAKHPAAFACIDGHRVRSKGEQLIDDCLSRLKIPHAYEIVIAFPPVQLVPAFVVHKPSGEMVYIEFVRGGGDSSLEARQKRNQMIYSERKLRVVALSETDVGSVEESLSPRLRELGICPV